VVSVMLVGLIDSGRRDAFINRIADMFAVDSPIVLPALRSLSVTGE
jgi:hypothetical protein